MIYIRNKNKLITKPTVYQSLILFTFKAWEQQGWCDWGEGIDCYQLTAYSYRSRLTRVTASISASVLTLENSTSREKTRNIARFIMIEAGWQVSPSLSLCLCPPVSLICENLHNGAVMKCKHSAPLWSVSSLHPVAGPVRRGGCLKCENYNPEFCITRLRTWDNEFS